MISTHETKIAKDPSGKKLVVTREFSAPTEKVWRAWTESNLLDKWWAPKPFWTETKSMDFKPGGRWLYCMAGPEGERHWCKIDYQAIDAQKNFSAIDGFCDEEGNSTHIMPSMNWFISFGATDTGTLVTVDISFESAEALEQIVAMGFKEGFTMAHGNLDELLAQ